MFFDQLYKCCCFIFLDWISFKCYCACLTSFNLAFILRESRVARFVCFSYFFSVSFRVSRHILHMRCWGLQRWAAVKFIVWIQFRPTGCRWACCGLAPAFLFRVHALFARRSNVFLVIFPLPLNSRSSRYKTFFGKRIWAQNDRDFHAERMSVKSHAYLRQDSWNIVEDYSNLFEN